MLLTYSVAGPVSQGWAGLFYIKNQDSTFNILQRSPSDNSQDSSEALEVNGMPQNQPLLLTTDHADAYGRHADIYRRDSPPQLDQTWDDSLYQNRTVYVT